MQLPGLILTVRRQNYILEIHKENMMEQKIHAEQARTGLDRLRFLGDRAIDDALDFIANIPPVQNSAPLYGELEQHDHEAARRG
jgi:hypothetical protein